MGMNCKIKFKNNNIKERFVDILNTGYSWEVLKEDFSDSSLNIDIKNEEIVNMLFNSINRDSIKDIGFDSYGYIFEDENYNTYIQVKNGNFNIDNKNNINFCGEFNRLKENWDDDAIRIRKEARSIAYEKDICIEFDIFE